MAKINIPDALKAAVPQTMWGRVLAATPVIMTVVATALAGLASSEMTRAQYSRSLAAQQQSKAGDQWGFFQAKRLRAALQRNTLDILHATVEVHPYAATDLDAVTATALQSGELPALPGATALDPSVSTALTVLEKSPTDAEAATLIAQVQSKALDEALLAAKERAHALDKLLDPITKAIEHLDKQQAQSTTDPAVIRSFTAARLRYTANRYDAEARVNQAIANLYEVQVRLSNQKAERHHHRSKSFFFGMLIAQAAVIIATFSLAAARRSLLWSLAAAGGAGAVSFAIYVYLFV
jgi:hypothetical protein